MDCSTPGLPVHHQLLKFTQTHIHWVSDAIRPSHPLSSPSPPAFNLSQHQSLFKWVSSSLQVAKVLEFQLQHQSYQCIFRLISFRMDWLDLLTVQGTLKSLLQPHSSKASILQHSAFFIVQLSHPYMTTRKTIALTRRTFVGKEMSPGIRLHEEKPVPKGYIWVKSTYITILKWQNYRDREESSGYKEEGTEKSGWAWLWKSNRRDPCSDRNLHFDCINANIVDVTFSYSFAKCYYRRKLGKWYVRFLCIIP